MLNMYWVLGMVCFLMISEELVLRLPPNRISPRQIGYKMNVEYLRKGCALLPLL